MAVKSLKIDSLELDLQNPRILPATDQRDAMQKILKEQGLKLVNLAESIATNGLNPMDRSLVTRSERQGKFIVLEGNRRLLALKLFNNPTLVNDLQMSDAARKRLLAAGVMFKARKLETLDCFEVADRAEGVEWIVRRHTGENDGRGIVAWSGIAAARFRGRDPGLQALEFVIEHGGLDNEAKEQIEVTFPISTLDRLLSTPGVRKQIGIDLKNGKLETDLPTEEAVKPLKRIVVDLLTEKINVTKVKSKQQQEDYVNAFKPADRPNLSKKTGTPILLEKLTAKGVYTRRGWAEEKGQSAKDWSAPECCAERLQAHHYQR